MAHQQPNQMSYYNQGPGVVPGNSPQHVNPSPADALPAEFYYEGLPDVNDGVPRFLGHHNKRCYFVYVDGACPNNGRPGQYPSGGYAFVYGPGDQGVVSGKLEVDPQTGNRAELRALLGVLEYRDWDREGCNEMIIILDSEYVAKGCVDWMTDWIRRGWRTAQNAAVLNVDLWYRINERMEELRSYGISLRFWKSAKGMEWSG